VVKEVILNRKKDTKKGFELKNVFFGNELRTTIIGVTLMHEKAISQI
jgi:hypothetical protein